MANTKELISIDQAQVKGLGTALIGMRVNHKKFGNGTILDIAEHPDKTHTLNIAFDDNATKWLMPKYANLTPADA
ncbi:MAG: hypothetical protein MJK04_17885 [Psychrosphaera sp.]|nr:hypothetical protein [Psychrosphaera sp.]